MADADSLIETEHRRRAAMMANDVDALAAILADRFHYAHINGLVEDRETYLARLRAGTMRCPYTAASDLTVVRRPGYALLTGRSVIGFAHDGGAAGEVTTLFTSVWEAGDDGWRIAAYASTPLPA